MAKRLGQPFSLTPCPYNPRSFQSRMEAVFGDRLRLRWSLRLGAWVIEQKVGRAALRPIRVEEWDDTLIRARDGYALVMVVQPGNRMACPFCHLTIAVPVMETAEARCEYCLSRNVDARFMTSFYPLGEVLIDHLKKIDPERREQRERVLREEAKALSVKELAEAADAREGAAQFKDSLLDQLPKAGFPSLVPDAWRH
ncbi:MAG TPA: hypothetical protein VEI97_20565 [bacterium]|nr:hypothetical protein [bacterium]